MDLSDGLRFIRPLTKNRLGVDLPRNPAAEEKRDGVYPDQPPGVPPRNAREVDWSRGARSAVQQPRRRSAACVDWRERFVRHLQSHNTD
jgi:hypothetical protein